MRYEEGNKRTPFARYIQASIGDKVRRRRFTHERSYQEWISKDPAIFRYFMVLTERAYTT